MIWQTARWLHGDAAGRWGAVLWMLLPAVSLGSFVMSTDTPLFFWSAALMFTVGALHQQINPTSMALAGVMIGTGMLAKYAAVYFAVGVVLFWVWQRRHRTTRPVADMGSADLAARQIGLLLAGMLLAASRISAGICCMILPRYGILATMQIWQSNPTVWQEAPRFWVPSSSRPDRSVLR